MGAKRRPNINIMKSLTCVIVYSFFSHPDYRVMITLFCSFEYSVRPPGSATQTPFCARHIGMLEFKAKLASTGKNTSFVRQPPS